MNIDFKMGNGLYRVKINRKLMTKETQAVSQMDQPQLK